MASLPDDWPNRAAIVGTQQDWKPWNRAAPFDSVPEAIALFEKLKVLVGNQIKG